LVDVLAVYFSDELSQPPYGSELASKYLTPEAPAKLQLRSEIRSILQRGDSLEVIRANPNTPVSEDAFFGDTVEEADAFLIENIWNVFWPDESPRNPL
jgi:hypothetical protein